MLTNHQLRDLTRGLRQSEPSKSPLNVILSAEIHALICGYFASLSMTRLTANRFLKATPKATLRLFIKRKGARQRQGFVILSAAKNPLIKIWILRLRLRMTRLTAHRLFIKEKATPRRELVAFRKNKALKLLRQELSTSET